MENAWGASDEAWTRFASTLGWSANLLPVVSNPNRQISADSKMRGLGKTPSQVNFRGEAAGIAKWTKRAASAADIKRWRAESDHGICVQTGNAQGGSSPIVIAFDIDVPDSAKSAAIRDALLTALPWHSFPERYREGTGKTLLAFEVEDGDELFKRIAPVDGGMVEMLALGQQFIAEGTYIDARTGRPDGRYLWRRLDAMPRLTRSELALLWDTVELFAIGEIKFARARRGPIEGVDLVAGDDPVAAWIAENWNVYDHDNDGRLFIECPFSAEHTTDSGPTATAYFPAGTGGYQRGHFDCKHAHCCDRTDAEFREALGFEADQFPDLGSADGDADGGAGKDVAVAQGEGAGRAALGPPREDWPGLIRDGNGAIQGNTTNLTRALACASMTGVRLAWDDFTAGIVWAPEDEWPAQWRPFKDEQYVDLRIALELRGFKPFSHDELRRCVHYAAHAAAIDTAQEWLSRLSWDGVRRVETFMADTLPGVGDSAYSRALSRYLWTTLAGRVLQPGVKADMLPVLVGEEGLRKSSWAAAIAPTQETFTDTVSLKHRDNDNSRKMRGRLVIELAELKGLASRDGEEIRAFLAQQYEEWTPKYMEANTTFPRRCLMVGTTNDEQFLEERMGMRRLLPVGVTGVADVERVKRDREQLWAEAALMFGMGGVDWSVEGSAQAERARFMSHDEWAPAVVRWLVDTHHGIKESYAESGERFGSSDVLVGALGIPVAQHDRAKQMRVSKVLLSLGCSKGKFEGGSRWYRIDREEAKRLVREVSGREGDAA